MTEVERLQTLALLMVATEVLTARKFDWVHQLLLLLSLIAMWVWFFALVVVSRAGHA